VVQSRRGVIRTMNLLLTVDLHYHIPWFRWSIEQAPGYDLVCIAGDLLTCSRPSPGRSKRGKLRSSSGNWRTWFPSRFVREPRQYRAISLVRSGLLLRMVLGSRRESENHYGWFNAKDRKLDRNDGPVPLLERAKIDLARSRFCNSQTKRSTVARFSSCSTQDWLER